VVEREGFEPSKATPADLQSAPFGQLGNLSKTDILILSKDYSVVKGLSHFFLDIFSHQDLACEKEKAGPRDPAKALRQPRE
jgi:hypothetical protein